MTVNPAQPVAQVASAKNGRNKRRRRRRAEKRAARGARTVNDGGGSASGPVDSHVEATALHSVGGDQNLPIKRYAAMRSRNPRDAWQALGKVMSDNAVSALRFLVSPGDMPAPVGIPDANMTMSVTMQKIMDGVNIERPSTFTGTTWSVMIMQFPSPELAAIVMYYDGTATAGTPILWSLFASGTNASYKTGRFWWSDVNQVDHRPDVINPLVVGTTGMSVVPEETVLANTLVPGAYSWTQTFGTDQGLSMSDFRVVGMSLTTILNANATQNQGLVYSYQPSRKVQYREMSLQQEPYFQTANTTDVPALHTSDGDSTVYSITDLPESFAALLHAKHYSGNAAEGNYVVGKWHSDFEYCSVVSERGCINLNLGDACITAPTTVYAPAGTNHLESETPIDVAMDVNFLPSLVWYNGLNPAATINAKFVLGVEAVPNPGGPLQFLAKDPPIRETAFHDVVESIAAEIPPGADAASNDFWDTLTSIGAGLWEVVKFAAPYVLAML